MLMMARAPKHSEQLMLTAEEVAWLLGYKCGKTILRMVQKDRFPRPMCLDGHTRWSRADVELWVECGGNMPMFNRRRSK